jgi:hypothetical protein
MLAPSSRVIVTRFRVGCTTGSVTWRPACLLSRASSVDLLT